MTKYPTTTNTQKIKELLKNLNIGNFIGPFLYEVKLIPSPEAKALLDLYLEQHLLNWQDRVQKEINNAKTTTYYYHGGYLELIPNYKKLLEYEYFIEALESSESLFMILESWYILLKTITNAFNGFIQNIITHLYAIGEENEEFKHLYKYLPRQKHNSISISIPVLPCYINIQYNYFKIRPAKYKHWCLNNGVVFFLKNLIENPYDYKELYFKNLVGLTSSTSWDIKLYKILNKAVYREEGLLLRYPESYTNAINSDELSLYFVITNLLFDILEHLQLKILLKILKGKTLKVNNNIISFMSDKIL